MKYLYVGESNERAERLALALNRAEDRLETTRTAEHAFFKILNEEIAAVLFDLTELDSPLDELLGSLEALDRNVEIALIGETAQIEQAGIAQLRKCSAFLTPSIEAKANAIALQQLTEKISLKRRLETLKNSAIIDGLTQLYNHAYFQGRLQEEIDLLKPEGMPVSLVMMDIDNFKHYNDRNGHPAGDKLLTKAADLVASSLRKFDLCARYGGEEFAFVLPNANLNTAVLITERVRGKLVTENFDYGEHQPLGFVSASFGVAVIDHQEITDKLTLIQRADQALYKAKQAGKNCVWLYRGGGYHAADDM